MARMIPILLVLYLAAGCAARSGSAEEAAGPGPASAGGEQAEATEQDRAAARRAQLAAYYRQVEEEARRRGRTVIWLNPPYEGAMTNRVMTRERVGQGPLVAP